MNQIIERLKALPKQYLIGAGIASIAIAVGITYKLSAPQKPNTPKNIPVASPLKSARRDSQSEGPQKTLIRLINSIKRILNQKTLESYEVIKAIYEGQFELSRTEAQVLIKSNRSERRKVINDLQDYVKLVSSYEDNLQEVHNKHLNALLAHFRIDKQAWMNLVEETSMQNKDDWDQVLVDTEDQELDSLRHKDKPKLKLSTLVDIYKYRAKKVSQQIPAFEEIKKDSEPSTLYMVIQKWTEDITAQKFTVEAEDINYSLKDLSREEKQQLDQYQTQVSELIEGLVLGDNQVLSNGQEQGQI